MCVLSLRNSEDYPLTTAGPDTSTVPSVSCSVLSHVNVTTVTETSFSVVGVIAEGFHSLSTISSALSKQYTFP